MGMDLLSNHGYERFSLRTWHECLKCAIEFGWKPEGTIAPTGFVAEWNGSYYGNNCQTVIVMPALWQRRFFVQLLRFRHRPRSEPAGLGFE